MEGWLMKKGWFNNWKMRYVTCSDQKLCIFKQKGDREGNSFNIVNCSIKIIDAKRWNRRFCFRVKFSDTRLYFAAEDETSLKKWTSVIQGRVQRASLMCAAEIRPGEEERRKSLMSGEMKRRKSTLASLARGDLLKLTSFNPTKYAELYGKAMLSPEDPEVQYQFSEICGEFLAICHTNAQAIFENNSLTQIDGIDVKRINSPEERKQILKQIRSLNALAQKKIQGVYIPLKCVIDFSGQSLVFTSKIENVTAMTTASTELLSRLELRPETTKAAQDSHSRLWIIEGDGYYKEASKDTITNFVDAVDKMRINVFDSATLSTAMKERSIPIKKLPMMAEMTSIPGVRILFQTEMIARACKEIFAETIKKVTAFDRNEAIIRFFNLVLGNGQESTSFWRTHISPRIKEKYAIMLDKSIPMLHIPQLFFSLQYHTGVDFNDSDKYNFECETPLKITDLSSVNAVPKHLLVELGNIVREIKEDPFVQINNGYFEEAMMNINKRVSMYQSIYGDENIFVASGLALLSTAYLGIGDIDKAILCANGALNAGREIHCALIPAYLTLISTALPHEVQGLFSKAKQIATFQLSDSHWFIADILTATAQAFQAIDNNNDALKYIHEAVTLVESLLGSNHPKTSRCTLIQGKINRTMRQFAVAEPLIQQALFSMKAAYGDDSPQCAECYFEFSEVLSDSGKLEEALEQAKKAIEIRSPIFEPESAQIIECVQQLALIYDQLNKYDDAFKFYNRLLDFLKRLEDENVFHETFKVMRNVLCLYFRSIGSSQRQLVNQIRRRKVPNAQDAMKEVFQAVLEDSPAAYAANLVLSYQESGDTEPFDALASLYHLAMDDMSELTWLEDH